MKRKLFILILSAILVNVVISAQEPPQWINDYYEALNNYDYSKADEILTKNFDRNNSDCCYHYGLANIDAKNYDYAIQWLEEALRVHTTANYYWKSTIYLKLAEIYNYLERCDEALEVIIQAKNDNIDNNRGEWKYDFSKIAEQYTKMEQYAKAEDVYYHILRYDKENENAKIDLAYLYLMYAPKEDSVLLDSVAFSLINEVLTIRPSSARAYYARAQYNQIAKQDYRAAIDDYLAFLYYDQDNTNNTDNLYYCAVQEFQHAITAINQWVKYCNTKERREKNKYFFIRKRAKVYENNAYYREAIDDYSEVLEDDPEGTNKLWALPSRGLCYLRLHEYQNAINDYTKCIEMSEDFDEYVYTQRAHAYTNLGKYDEAINDYSMVIKNSDEDDLIAYAYFQRGWIKEYLKNDRGALQDYNRSIELDSTNSSVYRQRGTIYLRLKYPEKAKDDFEYILNIDTVAQDGSTRHYALYYLGDTVSAIDWITKIIDYEPEDAGNYYDAACLYSLMGNPQKSVEFLHIAFELGYRDIIHVKRDRDLDSIRDLPEYKALIEKYEAESSTQKIEELLKQERSKMSDKDKLDLLREFNY